MSYSGSLPSPDRDGTPKIASEDVPEQENLFREIVASDTLLVRIFNAAGDLSYSNPGWQRFAGHAPVPASGRPLAEAVHPEDARRYEQTLARALSVRQPFSLEYRHRRFDGEYRWLRETGRPYFDSQGRFAGLVATATNIEELKYTEAALRASERKYRAIIDACSEAILVTNARNDIIAVNPAFTTVTGYRPDEALGRDPSFLASGLQDRAFYDEMWKKLQDTGRWQGEIWNRKKSGELFAEWLSISTIRDERGEIVQFIAIFSDITERKLEERRLKLEAEYDALTGLFNRRAIFARLPAVLKVTAQERKKAALLFVDLDGFKSVNDQLGHQNGDRLLRDCAKRLQSTLRKSDIIGRLGGDEFIIILPGIQHPEDVHGIVTKLLQQLNQPFTLDGDLIALSGSIGIALFPDHTDACDELLVLADKAMYRAKAAGRSCYFFADKEARVPSPAGSSGCGGRNLED